MAHASARSFFISAAAITLLAGAPQAQLVGTFPFDTTVGVSDEIRIQQLGISTYCTMSGTLVCPRFSYSWAIWNAFMYTGKTGGGPIVCERGECSIVHGTGCCSTSTPCEPSVTVQPEEVAYLILMEEDTVSLRISDVVFDTVAEAIVSMTMHFDTSAASLGTALRQAHTARVPALHAGILYLDLAAATPVRVSLFSVRGALLGTVHDGVLGVGQHAISLAPSSRALPAGHYTVRVRMKGAAQSLHWVHTGLAR